MKKTTKSNPLKFFNDNKSMAYKKAGSQMSTYKVKLKKAQDGIETENDMMINKPGYGAKKNVYTRPEPTPATKNTVYQGPISEKGNSYIERVEAKRYSYPLSTNNKINDIVQSDRNPKNSKRIEKGRPYVQLSRNTVKTQKQDNKNLWKDIWKEIRHDK